MKSDTVITSTGRTSTWVSSRVSRITACATVSPSSIAPPGMLHGLPHGREEAWRLWQGRADVLSDVPDADGHDVPGVGLPKDDRRRLTPFPLEGFPDRESGGVVAPADARVRRPSFEALVVAEHDDLPSQGVPQRVRVPGLDQLVPPRSWDHHDEEPIIEADRLEDANVVDQRERLHGLSKVLPNRVIHGRDGPSRRDEPSILLDAKGPDTERALNLRHREAAPEEVEDSLLRPQVRIRSRPVEMLVNVQRA